MDSIDCWSSTRQEAPKKSKNLSVFTNLYEIRVDRFPYLYYLYLPNPSDSTIKFQYNKHLRQYREDPAHFYYRIGYISRYKQGFLGTKKISEGLLIKNIEGK